ncbi:OB-fold domain-containing protein [Peribacillus frigoritolerans]|uniref:OB-fold domain-containing protein n=1 Tax=Peribacillus frigoritolerans TaxID=450367 RepID=UPI0020BE3EA5|nr:OB-fold domain-containing protein [Peribacillus frigoritolerans]
MKGIISYGAYIPYNRLQRNKLKEFFGTSVLTGERAVASYDEDSVSMGVEAALDCLIGFQKKTINSVIFATTSDSYKEKSPIPTISKALDLRDNVHGIDVAHSLRGGTSAILSAKENEETVVIASDIRSGGPSGQNEQLFGDGAAALLIGSGENVIAKIIDGVSYQEDIVAEWRSQSDPFTQNWEDRFGVTVFMDHVMKALDDFSTHNDISPDSISKAVISGPGNKAYIQVASKLGLQKEQIQDLLFDQIGAAGCAHAPMMLVSALEEAKPEERILLIDFAEGVNIILFEVTEAITHIPKSKGVSGYKQIKDNSLPYSSYLKWRGMLAVEPARRPATSRPSVPAMYRNYDQNLGFFGSKCLKCGTPQYPKQRVCIECQALDQMEPYQFMNKKATIVTYAVDYLAATPAPPAMMAVIDFEGGGRIISELTDCDPKEIEIGMEVNMSFRRLYEAGGIHNYFWKARLKR